MEEWLTRTARKLARDQSTQIIPDQEEAEESEDAAEYKDVHVLRAVTGEEGCGDTGEGKEVTEEGE